MERTPFFYADRDFRRGRARFCSNDIVCKVGEKMVKERKKEEEEATLKDALPDIAISVILIVLSVLIAEIIVSLMR